MRVLIVDDSKAMRMMVRRTLRQVGVDCDVDEAENGAAALVSMQKAMPDVVFSDWNMPEMSGIDFLREVRHRGWRTPFVLVTSEGSADMRAMAMKEGANYLVQKPFDAGDFSMVLSQIK
jgi:two-component system chemotaxis response regulator CheY